jgi:hypothetical protein
LISFQDYFENDILNWFSDINQFQGQQRGAQTTKAFGMIWCESLSKIQAFAGPLQFNLSSTLFQKLYFELIQQHQPISGEISRCTGPIGL